jgi:predicted AlkP superfamily pyrophosphatase or phosphodiesterase
MPTSVLPPSRLRAHAWMLALVGLLLAGCTLTPGERDAAPAPSGAGHLILISLDGFHPDYLERGLTPRINALASSGVRARWMTPSYPSLTFPNHYTLVTGLRPDRHGIVGNRMWDAELGDFRLGNRGAVGDGRWWNDAEPLWVSARRAGLQTATMFWPGSEAEIRGLRPHAWLPYSKAPSPAQRVEQVLRWLELPERPHFVTLYFEHVDTAGHEHGPDSAELDRELVHLDAAIGQLIDGIKARGLDDRIDLLLVSDHGMAATEAGQVVLLNDHVDLALLQTVSAGVVTALDPLPGHEATVEQALLGRRPGFECWRRHELPPQWRYGTHRRVAAIVCQADEGWTIATRRWRDGGGAPNPGAHGYDPALASMRALFIANGPSFRNGAVVDPFDNVDVYPLMTQLLGIDPQPHDGDGRTGQAMLRQPGHRR